MNILLVIIGIISLIFYLEHTMNEDSIDDSKSKDLEIINDE